MVVILNGTEKTLEAPLDLAAFLEREGYGEMLVAVAHNKTFVPRSNRAGTKLEDGDMIDIVAPMQGG